MGQSRLEVSRYLFRFDGFFSAWLQVKRRKAACNVLLSRGFGSDTAWRCSPNQTSVLAFAGLQFSNRAEAVKPWRSVYLSCLADIARLAPKTERNGALRPDPLSSIPCPLIASYHAVVIQSRVRATVREHADFVPEAIRHETSTANSIPTTTTIGEGGAWRTTVLCSLAGAGLPPSMLLLSTTLDCPLPGGSSSPVITAPH